MRFRSNIHADVDTILSIECPSIPSFNRLILNPDVNMASCADCIWAEGKAMFRMLRWVLAGALLTFPMPTVVQQLVGTNSAEARTICGFVGPVRVCRTVRSAPRRVIRKRKSSRKIRGTKRTQRAQIVRGDATLQAALNSLGYDAGRPDGKFGPQTRAAIKKFQKAYDQPVTGKLTKDQKDFLVTKYRSPKDDAPDSGKNRAQRSADKFLVLLRGGDPASDSGNGFVLPGEEDDQQPADKDDNPATLASYCDSIRQQKTGDIILGSSAGSLGNPIPREFCFTRAHLLSETEELYSRLTDPDPRNLLQRCSAFPANDQFKPILAKLGTDEPDLISTSIQTAFDANQELINSAKICLGLGLGFEDFNVSRAYATFLSGIGPQGYGEAVAGHFALGLGQPQNLEHAKKWYQWTADNIALGSDAIAELPANERAAVLAYLADSITSGGGLTHITLANQTRGQSKKYNESSGGPIERANAYFALEKYRILKTLPVLQTIVGMNEESLSVACSDANQDGNLGAFGAGDLDMAFVRLCRAAAYAKEKSLAMAQYDRILADAGDPDSTQAMEHHKALGR